VPLMAADAAPAQTDRDLTSIHEARALARKARQALPQLAEFSQPQIDALVDAMASAATAMAEAFARLAVEETGYGVVEDKIQKNLFSSEKVYRFIRPIKTVGVIGRDESRKIVEIAEPFGVVAAVIPSTNPTSTAIYKILIALKARCPIVISPHPAAVRCITRVAEVMHDAAARAGAPDGSIGWMKTVTIEGTQELMKHRDVAVILATGGMGLVRAAYSAGKPAYGVGPGNAPAYIERSADIQKAVRDIITGKTFDNGVLCSSENSVVTDEAIAEEVKREFKRQGAHFLAPAEIDAVGKALVSPQRLPNPALVGRSAAYIAEKAGVTVPKDTTVLIAELAGVGRDYPLSIEKLCPVLSFYVVKDWTEGCERCIQILRYGGMGHTMAIHSKNEDVILQFGLRKPAYRIVVNTPTTHGSVGLTTGLDPAMTLGCGGWGGNITSDNISPRHLINVKRLAYEVSPASPRKEIAQRTGGGVAAPAGTAVAATSDLLRAPAPPAATGVSAASLTRRIDAFLSTKGLAPGRPAAAAPASPPEEKPARSVSVADKPAEFVCEEDVRQALRHHRKIVIGDRSLITPAARDLGEQHKVFVGSGLGP
jgi:acetaldehyde dehydrogenase (acetylating)